MAFRKAFQVACGIAGTAAVVVAAAATTQRCGEGRVEAAAVSWSPSSPLEQRTAAVWDSNWDKREPISLMKPNKKNKDDTEDFTAQLENYKVKATRHIFLIRHSQYNLSASTDKERSLTSLGLEMMSCDLLREGAPIEPVPPVSHWKPEAMQYHEDGARIEAAFRRYIHRADLKQENDSYEIIVCHANVIRYFVCRALQFPPEGWLRMCLNNGSITWLTIRPNGRVALRTLGDTGFMPPDKLSR
ncbi:serine/threonine-protein phosphatase PGAM5, mitochondrial isoform X3 [Hemiscyllium ocellatum]|uniref:serine/threonine-protein phosphatase PGAM5, mitochondrial isoform X3 n=1 Tax=Hemiscyllium ocellatum TaxID=170820 RepID=UPI002965D79F|nr:serine/threonine-protein phosphatase PGAM5, mitochondrial isoform X3 [Hemiscyllium ocellatum]